MKYATFALPNDGKAVERGQKERTGAGEKGGCGTGEQAVNKRVDATRTGAGFHWSSKREKFFERVDRKQRLPCLRVRLNQ